MKAVISVIGHDAKGIIAKVSSICAEHETNIIDITQSVMKEYFAMVMVTELCDSNFSALSASLADFEKASGMKVHVMHEDIFNSMHRI
ncbi:MAG: ACT domain-containing protein [Ruminococcaceae bacterium]|nr:ACT domain-containing protein [Oscillospiraceae bacterium]